jgi:hypothetical protein
LPTLALTGRRSVGQLKVKKSLILTLSMRPNPIRTLVTLIPAALHAAVSKQGFVNAWCNVPSLETPSQYAMTASQALYSLLGVIIAILLLAERKISPALAATWAGLVCFAVGLILPAWAPEDIGQLPVMLAVTALGSALLAWLSVWASRRS